MQRPAPPIGAVRTQRRRRARRRRLPRPWVAAAEVAATNHDDRGASAPRCPWLGRSPIGGARGPGLAPSDEHAAVAAIGYGVLTEPACTRRDSFARQVR